MAGYVTWTEHLTGRPHAVFHGTDATLCGLKLDGYDPILVQHLGMRQWDGGSAPAELCPACRAAIV